jgi:predicted ATPase
MPTLQFVLHLARRAASMPVLLVGTYRTVELPRSHPLTGVLAELSREGLYQRLALQPLSRQETSALIENVDGVAPAQAVIDAIYRETAGNPFFTIELMRHVREQHQDLGNPPDKPAASAPTSRGGHRARAGRKG